MSSFHNVFHVSQPKQYNPDLNHILEPEWVQLRDDLTFHVPLAWIVDRGVKQLKNKSMPLLKVSWGKEGVEGYTWK